MYLDTRAHTHTYIFIYILLDTSYLIIIKEKEVINLKAEEHGSILKEELLEGGKRGEKLIEFYIRTH